MEMILPDCMMPDGADPCLGYQQVVAERDALKARVEAMLNDDWGSLTRERDALKALLASVSDLVWHWKQGGTDAESTLNRIDAALREGGKC